MNFLTDEQIDKAVNWWAEQVDHPGFDAGEDSLEMIMAETMASMLVVPVAQECKTKFKDELRSALKDKEYNPLQGVHTDYHPDLILFEVAQASGVSEHNFPWKTNMYFRDDGSVHVSSGYGGEIQHI